MGLVTYTTQVGSTTHQSLKAVSLKMIPAVRTVGQTYISRTGKGGEEPVIAYV